MDNLNLLAKISEDLKGEEGGGGGGEDVVVSECEQEQSAQGKDERQKEKGES